jgi:hypothetical protein
MRKNHLLQPDREEAWPGARSQSDGFDCRPGGSALVSSPISGDRDNGAFDVLSDANRKTESRVRKDTASRISDRVCGMHG